MPDPTATGDPLDQIIADYLQAAEAGQVPSRRELLDRHPEHAGRLNQFFADFDRLDNQAQGVRLNTRPPTERPKVRYFGDYELLEEIAEGGMGLVYKARQSTLGRVVALKLVESGRLARPIDVARFRVEAEAAAGLDHPNIVPLYEVGEHEGQHYLAMKFIDGPSLARLPRGSVRQEVERLEAVARAVDFAHRQGILHRDIKPSNILTDTNGTPYVTDFGLAKRLDAEMSLTESGQMLGTAGYIAPEQALGKKGLTVTADVFSLGAVLYERLTGQPAFPGGTILERLRSLHDAATPRPTVAAPGLPRDLETVTLKCLEREPGKRYATAGAVAEDLGRWLRGEAIVARPVGRVEKSCLWCRRNPWVAAWAGTASVALIGGTVTAWTLSIKLFNKERAAEIALGEAYSAQQTASKYLARAELTHEHFVHTLIQTFGVRVNDDRTPTERWAVFEIAKQDDVFKASLLAEIFALEKPQFRPKFGWSSEHVLQAAVGASLSRRQTALQLAKTKLNDPASDNDTRYAAMVLALFLGADDIAIPEWTGDSWLAVGDNCPWTVAVDDLSAAQVQHLTTHWLKLAERTHNSVALTWAFQGIDRKCELGHDAPAFASRGIHALVGVLGKTTDGSALWAAGEGLAALAPRLDGPPVRWTFDTLTGLLGKTTNPHTASAADRGLAALAKQLHGPEVLRAFDALTSILPETARNNPRYESGSGLAALAARLDEPVATRSFEALLGMLGKTAHGGAIRAAGGALAALAPRLDGPAAVRAFDALFGVLGKTTDGSALWAAGRGLAALAPRLDGPAASRAFDALLGVLKEPTGEYALRAVGEGLTALAPRLDGPAAVRAFDALFGVLGKTTDGSVLSAAGGGLAALAPRLDGPAAVRACDALVGVLGKTTDGSALSAAGGGLAALAPRLDGPAAGRVSDALIGVLHDTTDEYAFRAAGEALTAVAPRLDGPAAARASDALVGVLRRTTGEYNFWPAGSAAVALAPRLDGPAAARAADAWVGVLDKTTDSYSLQAAGPVLPALAARLDQPAAVGASDALIGVLSNATGPYAFQAAGQALAALAGRLDEAARERCTRAFLEHFARLADANTFELSRQSLRHLIELLPNAARENMRILAGQALVNALQRIRDSKSNHSSWDAFEFLIDEFSLDVIESLPSGALTIGDTGSRTNYTPTLSLAAAVFSTTNQISAAARWLTHPACVGDIRRHALRRLEQLAFPPTPAEQQRAVAESVVTGLAEPLAAGVLAAGREARARKERKFRTIWDAVAWLKVHHPEIDLDKPYTPRR